LVTSFDVEGGFAVGAGGSFHVVVHQEPVTIVGAGFDMGEGESDDCVLLFS